MKNALQVCLEAFRTGLAAIAFDLTAPAIIARHLTTGTDKSWAFSNARGDKTRVWHL